MQFVRKISGIQKPSGNNAIVLAKSIEEITISISKLINSLETKSKPKNSEEEIQKHKLRNQKRVSKNEAKL